MRFFLIALAALTFATSVQADPLDGIIVEPEVDAV